MPTKKRYIDVFSTKLRFVEDSVSNPIFADILRFMDGKECRLSGKIYEFSLINTTIPNCIVGIIITTQDKDIPPKRNKENKVFYPLEIDTEVEGLAFANIFLYDTRKNIFLYEINKNGCFPKQLITFIYKIWNAENEDIRFDLSFPTIFRANEYQRMLQMRYYKKITVELFNPTELITCFDESTNSLENNILKYNLQASNQNNADTLLFEQIAMDKKLNTTGLRPSVVKGIVDAIINYIAGRGHRQNIQTLEVVGYSENPEDKAQKTIDLIADTFNEYFRITDIQVQEHVQQEERKEGIESLYVKLLPEFNQLIR